MMIDVLKVAINIDGIPLNKSTGDSFWPISCQIRNVDELSNDIFAIAIYHGVTKPPSNELLFDFVEESKKLCVSGIQIGVSRLKFNIEMIICDSPAKAYVMSIKGHNGYNACSKCWIEGEYFHNVMCYGQTNFRKRTDAEFRNKMQQDHHVGISLIEELPDFDLVGNVPLDYMHVVLLGVSKRLLCHNT